VSLFFEMQRKRETPVADFNTDTTTSFIPEPLQVRERFPALPQSIPPKTTSSVLPAQRPPWRLWEDGYAVKSDSPEWDAAIAELAAEIKTRHYPRKTLKTYAHWSRQFQRFLKNKPPKSLSSKDVKEYLTYLAVQCRVSASTQNQAFNALLFLFRHALKHFEAGILTVHGKGKKDRTVPLPETIVPELTSQLEVVKNIHDEDLAAGLAGVFLDDRLEKKYPSAAKNFIWQWFFPQKTLTQVSAAQELRGDIICTRLMSRMRFTRLYAGLNSPSASLLIPSATQLCHSSFAGQLRYQDDPDTTRPQ